MADRAKRTVRILLLLVLLLVPAYYWYSRIENIRSQYQVAERAEPQRDIRGTCWKDFIAEMSKQSQLLITWGVLLLAGVTALATTTKIHPIPNVEWVYLLLAPATSFLLGSLWAGVVFERRLTYLMNKDGFGSVSSLYGLLGVQSELFEYGVVPLGLFALCFLATIVWGAMKPFDLK